jgi:hypothetical protein
MTAMAKCPRPLRVQLENGKYQQRTPAMAAGVASYPWSVTQVAQLLD